MEERAVLRSAPRTGVRRAAIDVGTNSVKLLVAEVDGGQVRPIRENSLVTRLGRGFYETQLLQADAIAQTATAVAEFTRAAHDAGAQSLRVIATSAAREARNGGVLVEALLRASGQELEIITGEQEADWVFRGVTSDTAFASGRQLIMDVGGGSTEFILGEGGRLNWCQSHPMGVVRLLEALRPADPPTTDDLAKCRKHVRAFIESQVAAALAPQLTPDTRLIGVGGTATVLASMELGLRQFDRDRLHDFKLTRDQVGARVRQLWSLPHAQRGTLAGLPPKRADVILTGAVIYETVMERFGITMCHVSTRGLRYAAVMDAR